MTKEIRFVKGGWKEFKFDNGWSVINLSINVDDFNLLPEFINYLKENKVYNTIITSGISVDFDKKLKLLVDAGLESMSTSYDVDGNDKYSKAKGNKAFETLKKFKTMGGNQVKDLAVIMTITKLNYKRIPEVVKENSKKGIWTLFDMIHKDRNQAGSKTNIVDFNLLFAEEDLEPLKEILKQLLKLKQQNYLLHTSESFLNYLIQHIDIVYKLNWNCGFQSDFPAWLTINYDLEVFPCDDFQPDVKNKIYADNLYDNWYQFKRIWKSLVIKDCPGCCWNTHIDAHLIKQDKVSFSDYVHYRDKDDE